MASSSPAKNITNNITNSYADTQIQAMTYMAHQAALVEVIERRLLRLQDYFITMTIANS
jgi:hypothetical protein